MDNRWRNARSLLVICPDAPRDVLAVSPAVRALRDGMRDGRLTLLTGPRGLPFAQMIPDVDATLSAALPWNARPLRPEHGDKQAQRLIATLRTGHFDGVVIFAAPGAAPQAVAALCAAAGIPLRLAFSVDDAGGTLTDWRPPLAGAHLAAKALALVAAAGFRPDDDERGLILDLPDDGRATVFDLLTALRIEPDRPLIALHLGGATLTAARLATLATHLVERQDALVFLTGHTADHALARMIVGLAGNYARRSIVDLTGRLDLAALAALLETADALVTADETLMAVASAVKTPVVALFARPEDAALAAPWETPHVVLCDPQPEMITPNAVAEAIAALLAEVNTPAGLGAFLHDAAALASFEAAGVE